MAPDEPAVHATGQSRWGRKRRWTPPAQMELLSVALVCAAATVFFGFIPEPLFNLAAHAGASLTNIF